MPFRYHGGEASWGTLCSVLLGTNSQWYSIVIGRNMSLDSIVLDFKMDGGYVVAQPTLASAFQARSFGALLTLSLTKGYEKVLQYDSIGHSHG